MLLKNLLMIYLRFTFVYREKKAGMQGKKRACIQGLELSFGNIDSDSNQKSVPSGD